MDFNEVNKMTPVVAYSATSSRFIVLWMKKAHFLNAYRWESLQQSWEKLKEASELRTDKLEQVTNSNNGLSWSNNCIPYFSGNRKSCTKRKSIFNLSGAIRSKEILLFVVQALHAQSYYADATDSETWMELKRVFVAGGGLGRDEDSTEQLLKNVAATETALDLHQQDTLAQLQAEVRRKSQAVLHGRCFARKLIFNTVLVVLLL